jgi:hypothetical protein
MHEAIAEQFGVADDLPCADSAFLGPVKRSLEFRRLRPRLAGPAPHPVFDSWMDDGFHFFVFLLAGANGGEPTVQSGMAVFAAHPEAEDLVSAVTVVPTEDGGSAEIANLKAPGGSYTVPLQVPPRPQHAERGE